MAHSLYALLDEYYEYLETRSISANTIKNHKITLKMFRVWAEEEAKDFPLTDLSNLTRKHVRQFFHYRKIVQATGEGTRKQNYQHLNLFFKWVKKEYKILKKNPIKGVEKPEYTPPLIVFPAIELIQKMIESCDSSFLGIRDKAILLLLRDTGGRASEITQLRTSDVNNIEQVIHVRNGKGGKEREIPFSDETALALAIYEIARQEHPNNQSSSYFITQRGGISYGGIREICYRHSLEVSDTRLSPHKWRHAFVHEAKTRGVTEDALLELCGWSTRAMLDHYGRSMRKERANDEYRAKMGRSKEE